LVLFGAFFVFAFLFLAAPSIPDADSYYHLAVAREYAAHGYSDALPWARFSLLGQTFGDKELLFHGFLAPFARTDAATGGRLALALLNAVFAALITLFASRALGWWSVLVPLWLHLAAPMLVFRLIRLRPELLALLLLVPLIHFAATKRYVLVAICAAVFALSYTAFHVVPGLAVLWFALHFREREWKLPVAAVLGSALGLLVHPGFPGNLRIWWAQNVLFFLERANLDVGSEIAAPSTFVFFLLNAGWWIGIGLLWLVSRDGAADRRRTFFFGVAAAAFAVLAVLMERMAIYFVPLVTLVLLEKLAARIPAHRARVAMALLATALFSAPRTIALHRELLRGSGIALTYERDYAELGRKVPAGAKVAAHWGPAELYTFWAPQGRYLNVLDPIFMAVPYPRIYAAQRGVFDGSEPDVPGVVKHTLDSDYIAFDTSTPLFERIQADPRIVPLHVGFTFLGRIDELQNQRFVRDWRLDDQRAYPATGAYIDARRISRAECVRFVHDENVPAPVTRLYELAPYGSAEVRVDDRLHVRTEAASRAILGKGLLFRIALAQGPHRITVTSCAANGGRNGFYLLRRR
jgi:hypothetical protein